MSQSVSPGFFFSVKLLWNRSTEFHETLLLWSTWYMQEILIQLCPFWNEMYYWNSSLGQLLWNHSTEFGETLLLWFRSYSQCVDVCICRKFWFVFFAKIICTTYTEIICHHSSLNCSTEFLETLCINCSW